MSSRRMRVLAVINALGEGGTERSLAELLDPLEDRGVDVALMTLRSRGEEGVEPDLRAQGRPIHRLPSGRRRPLALRRFLADQQLDVVHSMLYEANVATRLGAWRTGVPVLTSLVNTSYSPERLEASGLPRWKTLPVQAADAMTSAALVDHFHAVSEAVRDDAVRHLGIRRRRITVIPRGRHDPTSSVPADARARIRAELGLDADQPLVVAVGRHEAQKDYPTLLEAMSHLHAGHPDATLAVAGREGADTPRVEATLEDLGPAARRVRLLGHRRDVPLLLAAADVFVLASRHEGMPGSLIEAMALRCPAVASDIGPVREVAGPGASALVVKPGDARGFADAIGRLLVEPARREALGARGRRIFEERFTIDRSADSLAALYAQLATRSHRR